MILPIHNGAATVASVMAHVLEILPELTPRWDLQIIDDGSTDSTSEILAELVRTFPQVSVIHHSVRQGDAACFRAAARRSRGDILLFRSSDCDLDIAGLHKMWKRLSSHDLIVARSHADSAVGRMPAAFRRSTSAAGVRGPALQMIRRRALEGWLTSRSDQDLQAYLAAKRYPQLEVELRHAPFNALASTLRQGGTATVLPQHCDRGDSAGRPKRPNYLLRIKAFALGE